MPANLENAAVATGLEKVSFHFNLKVHHQRRFTVKDRNGKDLTEAETIKKRWQEYTEEYTKRSLNDPDNDNGVLTHLEPDILSVKESSGLSKHYYEKS